MTRLEKKEFWKGIAFVSPWLIGMSVFLAYPVIASLYHSFCDYSVLSPAVWIGLGNYADLFHDEIFWYSLYNTFYFAIVALPLGLLVSLALALLLNAEIHGRAIFRTIFFLPSLVPMVALAILWQWIFTGEYGILNYVLRAIGISHPPNWLGSITWSKPALIITSVWGIGNAMVIYLAGLQEIPQTYYEAADIDGANWFQKIFAITLPMLSPVIYFNLIMGIIASLQIFAVPYIMTGGGPARSTLFYTMYLYDNAFRYLNMGYASAMAWIMFVVILALTIGAHKASSKHVYYEGA